MMGWMINIFSITGEQNICFFPGKAILGYEKFILVNINIRLTKIILNTILKNNNADVFL